MTECQCEVPTPVTYIAIGGNHYVCSTCRRDMSEEYLRKNAKGFFITPHEMDILDAARAYVAAQRAVPSNYEWSDPRIDEMLAARDELIRVVEEA